MTDKLHEIRPDMKVATMKSLVKTASGAAVLLLALTACASAAKTDSAASGQSATTVGSTPTTTASGGSAPGDTPTANPTTAPTSSAPGQLPTGAVKPTVPPNGDQVKYTSPEGVSVAADGRTLSAPVTWGGCTEQPQLLVTEQSGSQVVVEVKTVTHFKLGAMCPNIAREGEAVAVLNAPLGGRALIDGVTHKPISH